MPCTRFLFANTKLILLNPRNLLHNRRGTPLQTGDVMSSIELKIRDFLNDNKDVMTATNALTQSWRKNLYDPKEQFVVAQFYLNAGLKSSFLKEVRKLIDEERHLPWAQISEVLNDLQCTPSLEEQKAIVNGIREQDAMSEVLRSPRSVLLAARIAKTKTLSEAKSIEKQNEIKMALREKIEFLRSQRMMDDESIALKQYHLTYPDDQDASLDQKAFDERWARHIVGENIDHRSLQTVIEEKGVPLSKDQMAARKLMLTRAKDIVQKTPEKNYDLAMTLAFMDFYEDALEVLRLGPRENEAEWFELEILLKSRRFLEALELSQQLEVKFVDEPESSFAAIYARARALWGLGQKTQAIEFMKSIVKVKANYKNAHSLLNYWTGQS